MNSTDYWVRQRLSEARYSYDNQSEQWRSMSSHKQSLAVQQFSSAVNHVDAKTLKGSRPMVQPPLCEHHQHTAKELKPTVNKNSPDHTHEPPLHELTGVEALLYNSGNMLSYVASNHQPIAETLYRQMVSHEKGGRAIESYRHYFSKFDQLIEELDRTMAFIHENEEHAPVDSNHYTFLFDGGKGGSFSISLKQSQEQSWQLSIENVDLSHEDLMQLTQDLKGHGLL